MASGARTAATITVRFRTAPNVGVSAVSLVDADADVLAAGRGVSSDGAPAEALLGSYWSATEGRHVIYESRLELARLLFADFDRSVHRICAQPFLLVTRSHGRMMKIIP